jgi:hypothetical protein
VSGSDGSHESNVNPPPANLFPELAAWLADRATEFDGIPVERRATLQELARVIERHLAAGFTARLVFICTHNSRRSQMCQVWAQTAADRYRLQGVTAYSGGTETAAFDPRAVAALRRAGFRIDVAGDRVNPVCRVRYSAGVEPIECLSKRYDQPPNPTGGFCAVMTCSEADHDCPVVLGADDRVSLPYDDPKQFDGTDQESALYDERCRQIAREMLYVCAAAAGDVTRGGTARPNRTANP